MGLCSRYKSLTCNSCSMHCQIMPEESPRLQYCANSCFCMWPEESSYFNRGVVEVDWPPESPDNQYHLFK